MSELELLQIVSENIGRIMKENNLNQVEFAEKIGVQVSTVGKWLKKKSMPRAGMIEKISEIFNVPKSHILNNYEKETETNSKALQTIAAHMDGADPTPEELNKITEYIDFVLRDVRNKK